MSDIQGQTVLITGASRGIGAAAAREFAAAGANVVLMARSGQEIERIAAETGGIQLPKHLGQSGQPRPAPDTRTSPPIKIKA